MTWPPSLDTVLVAIGAFALVFLFWIVTTANRFTRLRNHILESWADIDVQLKRRHDLVPNLVETVRGYAAHEKTVLDSVERARQLALKDARPSANHFMHETALVAALNSLFIRTEAYPVLKANAVFVTLQNELASTEDRIAAARRFFNANVRDFNTMLDSFPSSIVGTLKGLRPMAFFQVEELATRAPIHVSFTEAR